MKPQYCPNCGKALDGTNVTKVGIYDTLYEVSCPNCKWVGDITHVALVEEEEHEEA